jgi:hypothetical protein
MGGGLSKHLRTFKNPHNFFVSSMKFEWTYFHIELNKDKGIKGDMSSNNITIRWLEDDGLPSY